MRQPRRDSRRQNDLPGVRVPLQRHADHAHAPGRETSQGLLQKRKERGAGTEAVDQTGEVLLLEIMVTIADSRRNVCGLPVLFEDEDPGTGLARCSRCSDGFKGTGSEVSTVKD